MTHAPKRPHSVFNLATIAAERERLEGYRQTLLATIAGAEEGLLLLGEQLSALDGLQIAYQGTPPPVRRICKLRAWSEARRAMVTRDWPAGVPTLDLLQALNQMPGRPIHPPSLRGMAYRLNVQRPLSFLASGETPAEADLFQVPDPATAPVAGAVLSLQGAIGLPRLEASAEVKADAIVQARMDLTSEVGANGMAVASVQMLAEAPRRYNSFGYQPLFRGNRARAQAQDAGVVRDAIADFIAKNGITRCPAAFSIETSATLSIEDRRAVAEYQRRNDAQAELQSKTWSDKLRKRKA